jgi:hypothetical protein
MIPLLPLAMSASATYLMQLHYRGIRRRWRCFEQNISANQATLTLMKLAWPLVATLDDT